MPLLSAGDRSAETAPRSGDGPAVD